MVILSVCLVIAALILTAVMTSLIRVDTINYGVVLRFGRRTGRVLKEGLHLILPFGIETVELVPCELREIKFNTPDTQLTTLTKDRLLIEIRGELQYRPAHPNTKYQVDGRKKPLILRFLETTDNEITTGLLGAIKNELGAIAGVTESDGFIADREALGLLIDSMLRLEKPAHFDNNLTGGGPVDKPGKRLAFYKAKRKKIREKLAKMDGSHSALEKRYGIDITTLTLSKVSLSTKVIEAMEKQKEEEYKKKAIKIQVEQFNEGVKSLQDEGKLTKQQAYSTMAVLTGAADKLKLTENDIKITGLKPGAVPLINFGNQGNTTGGS